MESLRVALQEETNLAANQLEEQKAAMMAAVNILNEARPRKLCMNHMPKLLIRGVALAPVAAERSQIGVKPRYPSLTFVPIHN